MRLNGYIPLEELHKAIKPFHCYQLEARVDGDRWYVVIKPTETRLYKQNEEKTLHVNGDVIRIGITGLFISRDTQGYIPDHIVSAVKELSQKEYALIDRDYTNMENAFKRAEEQIRTEYRQEIKP